MALTPQNSEAFVREVDEELRREQIVGMWQRYGKLLIGAIILVLAVVAGAIWWQAQRQAQVEASAETLVQALRTMSELDATVPAQRPAKAAAITAGLAKLHDARAPYGSTARLGDAALLSEQGQDKAAAVAFRAIAADSSAPQPYRDIATLRAVALDFDRMPPQQVVTELKPLAVPGSPWFGSAAEMTALALLKSGQRAPALAMIRALQRDLSAPKSIRDRSLQIGQSLDPDFATTQIVVTPKP